MDDKFFLITLIDFKKKILFPQVVALQHCCSYKPCLPELSVQSDVPVSGLVEEEQVGVHNTCCNDKLRDSSVCHDVVGEKKEVYSQIKITFKRPRIC